MLYEVITDAEPLRGELNTADLRGRHDVSGNANHEQVAQSLIEIV